MANVKPMLSLKQFILRQEVLKLYRKIFRAIREVPDEVHRKELRDWARSDFRAQSHHTDEITIKMMLNYGERSLKELQTSLNLAK
ncbi:PREDICTED: LYR motif-containing protein 2 [Nicrophorus vespilloides]|uniref:LYR motif-containing protein 2 n=1 Tax=Nicrophorus vespilloides TaxID=110193 RepID=A0ABM1MLA6_NICVS|nr:PREDICTED: LYR motif-containing protein 2 [Nicrophorus vespilloides]